MAATGPCPCRADSHRILSFSPRRYCARRGHNTWATYRTLCKLSRRTSGSRTKRLPNPTAVVFVSDHSLDQPMDSSDDEPAERRGGEALAPIDVPFASFQQATLKSERIRIIGLILVLGFIEVVMLIRALFGGVPGQLDFLPRFTALIVASVSYETLMLGILSRAMKLGSDLPRWAWSANAVIEALVPTILLILITESSYMGPYRALGSAATHGYYIFIILSTLRLRPGLCLLTGLVSALGFAAATAYTFVVHPEGPDAGRRAYPIQVYATFSILLMTCGAIAAWLSSQFRRHVLAALGEAAIRADLTERVRLQGRIVQAEKLASLGLLSAGVAHEINNPLAYVINNLAVLERDFQGLALVLAAYEEARPILETANPDLAERVAQLSLEHDLPYIKENLGPILQSTRRVPGACPASWRTCASLPGSTRLPSTAWT